MIVVVKVFWLSWNIAPYSASVCNAMINTPPDRAGRSCGNTACWNTPILLARRLRATSVCRASTPESATTHGRNTYGYSVSEFTTVAPMKLLNAWEWGAAYSPSEYAAYALTNPGIANGIANKTVNTFRNGRSVCATSMAVPTPRAEHNAATATVSPIVRTMVGSVDGRVKSWTMSIQEKPAMNRYATGSSEAIPTAIAATATAVGTRKIRARIFSWTSPIV